MGVQFVVTETSNHTANVAVVSWDADAARNVIPEYNALSPWDRSLAAWCATGVATDIQRVSNTTCIGLSEHIVDVLDASTEIPTQDGVVEVGDGTSTPAYTDTSLSSKVTEVDVRTYADEGEQVRYRAFLPGNAANGTTISELGVRVAGKLLNHSLLDSTIDKDENTEATLTVLLSFNTA